VKRIFSILNAVIAMGCGLIVLIGTFFNLQGMRETRLLFFQWAVILAGVAVLVGIWNLFSVHLQKIRTRQPGSLYSLILLFFMLLSLLFSSVTEFSAFKTVFLNGIILPAEISLLALLAVTLLYALIRMLRTRTDLPTLIFLATALAALLLPVLAQFPAVNDLIRPALTNLLAAGGARGILIGVALGTLTTGLRILLGADRPYGGK
jgi:hypothetical protein